MAAEAPGDSRPARQVEVDDLHAGQRIDNFLLRTLKGVPRPRVYRILRRGEVRVNGARARQGYRLRTGDVVRIPPVRTASTMPVPEPSEGLVTALAARVLVETAHWLAIDKPAGLAVHGGSGQRLGLIEALRASRPGDHALELVHRLDRETSGCLLVARRRSALTALHRSFREGRIRKRYLALVHGRLAQRRTVVDAPLLRRSGPSGERMVGTDAHGKQARTAFVALESFPGETLVEATPFTGRTHQIRVHAASCGHPLAGDDRYGDRAFDRRLRPLGLKRLFLHASRLRFSDPATGAPVTVEAPLPPDLRGLLDALGACTALSRRHEG